MSTQVINVLDLPEEMKETVQRYLMHIKQQWEEDVEGVLLFGSAVRGDFIANRSNINILVVFRRILVRLLQRGGTLHQQWGQHQIIAPLMTTQNEMHQSCGLFPLEYFQMKEHHVLLAGRDPFVELHINEERLGWQCEQELMGNLIRIRQRFVEGEGRPEAIQALLILSITSLIPCLRGFLRVLGHPSMGTDKQILDRLPHCIQFEPAVLFETLNMKRGTSSPGSLEWMEVYERYLHTLESLWERLKSIRQAD